MNTFLINFYNQVAAGPKNISLNFIREASNFHTDKSLFFIIIPNTSDYKKLVSTETTTIIKLPHYNHLYKKLLFRIYLDLYLIPKIIRINKIKSMLAFGNYLVSPTRINKIVLLHHPYLVDNELLRKLKLKERLIEKTKRAIFFITLRNVEKVVVQSDYMKNALVSVWKIKTKNKINIIHNPISKKLSSTLTKNELNVIRLDQFKVKPKKLLYVSRYYPHKNHDFLLELSRELKVRGLNISLYVTLDAKNPEVSKFLNKISNEKLCIINLGELDQQDLVKHYKSSFMLLFPSKSETFGNPLIEALKFSLPTIAPNLPYAHTILGDSGTYYIENNTNDCIKKISLAISDEKYYMKKVSLSGKISDTYTNTQTWFTKYFSLLNN